jgi:hypothetical protein
VKTRSLFLNKELGAHWLSTQKAIICDVTACCWGNRDPKLILTEMGKAMKSMNVKNLFFTYSQLLPEMFISNSLPKITIE